MAKDLPDALQLREAKYGLKTTPEQQVQAAAQLEEADHLAEALDLSLLAGAEERIDGIRRFGDEVAGPLAGS